MNRRAWNVSFVVAVSVCTALAVCPVLAREHVLVTYKDGYVLEYDVATGDFVREFASGLAYPIGITTGPDGNVYVHSDSSDEFLRYDSQTSDLIDVFATDPVDATGGGNMTFGPDGDLYAAYEHERAIWRFDGSTGASLGEFTYGGANTSCMSLDFGPSGDLYVAASSAGGIRAIERFNGSTGAYIESWAQDDFKLVTDVAFGPNGNLYAADNNVIPEGIKRFDGSTGELIDVFVAPAEIGDLVIGLGFSEDGDLFLTTFSGPVLRFDGTTGALEDTLVPPGDYGWPLYMTFIDVVPEPGTGLLGCLAFAAVALVRRGAR